MIQEGRIPTPVTEIVANAASATYPASVVLSGTVSTDNADATGGLLVTGVGTDFIAAFCRNSDPGTLRRNWMFSISLTEVMEIDKVLSATTLLLKHKFTSSLSGATVYYVKAFGDNIAPTMSISFITTTAAQTFTIGTPNASAASVANSIEFNTWGTLKPIAVKMTGTGTLQVSYIY